MEVNRQIDIQPNSENEFQSEKEEDKDIWMQPDNRWLPVSDEEK
jgi:hypothetical protein